MAHIRWCLRLLGGGGGGLRSNRSRQPRSVGHLAIQGDKKKLLREHAGDPKRPVWALHRAPLSRRKLWRGWRSSFCENSVGAFFLKSARPHLINPSESCRTSHEPLQAWNDNKAIAKPSRRWLGAMSPWGGWRPPSLGEANEFASGTWLELRSMTVEKAFLVLGL